MGMYLFSIPCEKEEEGEIRAGETESTMKERGREE